MKREFSRKEIFIAFFIFIFSIIALVIVYLVLGGSEEKNNNDDSEVKIVEFKEVTKIEMQSLKEYNTTTNCWIGYNGYAYDITEILKKLKDVKASDCGNVITNKLSSKTEQQIFPYQVVQINQ